MLYLHPETNQGKIDALEALHAEYVSYVSICVETMLSARRLNLKRSEKQVFFPRAEKLTSQIEKNARDHAVSIVSGWARSRYVLKLKSYIKRASKGGRIDPQLRKQLFTVGKYLLHEPSKTVTQEAIDLYHSWLFDLEIGGNTPRVSLRLPMRLSENTSTLADPKDATLANHWLKISTLVWRKVLWLPLKGNPYVRRASDVSKGISARKDRQGRWRFEVVDCKEWGDPRA